MDQTTQQADASAPGAVPADAPIEDQFQSLWDRGAFDTPAEPAEAQQSAAEPAKAEPPAEPEADAKAADKASAPPEEPEGKDYASLDEYLTEQKLDRDSFLSLPVSVKVDGVEQSVPLAEVVKGYQLSSAGYQRMSEIAQQRTQFQAEQQQVRQALGLRIQQTEALLKAAQEQLLGDYNAISPAQWAQLRAENPGEYAALQTQFSQRQQALQAQIQQVALAKQQEAQQAEHARLQALPAEREKLLAARPEWRDPAKLAAAQQSIVSAGRKLGFTDAELQSLIDHRHVLVLDLAAKQLQLQASQPGVMKRVRAAPKMAPATARNARDPKRDSINQALSAAAKSGFRDEHALAAAFEAVG